MTTQSPPPTPEEIARWREQYDGAQGGRAVLRLCDEVERLRAENEALHRQIRIMVDQDLAALVSPPPRTEEEPAGGHVHPFPGMLVTGCVCANPPAPSQPQKATHPFDFCCDDCGIHCRCCGLPASDPIHAAQKETLDSPPHLT